MEVNQVEFGRLKVVNNICSTLSITERYAQQLQFAGFNAIRRLHCLNKAKRAEFVMTWPASV